MEFCDNKKIVSIMLMITLFFLRGEDKKLSILPENVGFLYQSNSNFPLLFINVTSRKFKYNKYQYSQYSKTAKIFYFIPEKNIINNNFYKFDIYLLVAINAAIP